jgi:hypothetical protein
MLVDLGVRFVIGGLVVSAFAALGEVFTPKRFAGLFAAAPSVALATLALTIAADGRAYAATEARSMIAGAMGFFAYAACVSRVMIRAKPPVLPTVTLLLVVWASVSWALWLVLLK